MYTSKVLNIVFETGIMSVTSQKLAFNSGNNPIPIPVADFSAGGVMHPSKALPKSPRDASAFEASICSFIETVPDSVILTAADRSIQQLNRNAEAMFNYRNADVAGRDISILFNDFDEAATSCVASLRPDNLGGDPLQRPLYFNARKKSGEIFPVEKLARQFILQGEIVTLHYVRDLSFKQRFEQRIEELQREVTHLSRQSVLGQLATAITHELNQPLTAITNYTAAARRCSIHSSPEELESSLDLMDKAAVQAKRAWQIMHRLRKLVQHRGAECRTEDLRTTVDEAIQLATLGAPQSGINVDVSLWPHPVIVNMDRVQIQILLANLVRNAVDELSALRGERKLSITLSILPDDTAQVSVADNGPGIAPQVFENIFDPFHTTKPQGLGMGLAVSRRIAEAHGGRLSAENLPDGGALFSFIIPLSKSE